MFEYLYYINYIVFGFEFILAMANLKYPKSIIRVRALPALLVVAALGYLLIMMDDRAYFNFFFPMVSIVAGIGIVFAVSEDDGFKGIFPLLSGLFFITISDTIGNSVYVYALHTWNDWRVIVPEAAFMAFVLAIVIRYVRPMYVKTLRYDNLGWAALDAVIVVYGILIYMMSVTNDFEDLVFIRVGIELLALIVFIYASVVSGRSAELQRLEYEKRLLNWQVKTNILQTEDMNETERRMSRVRHDIRHKLIVLERNINENRTEDALNLIHEIDEELEKTRRETYCSNTYVNTVLTMYSSKCKAGGIKYSAIADVPSELPIDITELTAMMAGVIEEAFRNCSRMSSKEERYLGIQARSGADSFILEVEYTGRIATDKYNDLLSMFRRIHETIIDVDSEGKRKKVKLLVNY